MAKRSRSHGKKFRCPAGRPRRWEFIDRDSVDDALRDLDKTIDRLNAAHVIEPCSFFRIDFDSRAVANRFRREITPHLPAGITAHAHTGRVTFYWDPWPDIPPIIPQRRLASLGIDALLNREFDRQEYARV